MGIITVERHVFYAEAVEYNSPGNPDFSRMHLRVRNIRVPWSHGEARTIGYLDELQFGGTIEKVPIATAGITKRFFMGEGFNHPKLIVTAVGIQDLHDKQEMGKLLVTRYKARLNQHNFPERVVPRVIESVWDKLPDDEKAAFARPASGSRLVRPSTANKPVSYLHKFEFGPVVPGEVWLLVDPTYPEKRGVTYETAVDLAKEHLGRPVETTLFQHMDKNAKVFNTEGVIILGIAYRLQYWRQRLPKEPVQWLDSVQRRVREYLRHALHANKPFQPQAKFRTLEFWYAMGDFSLPIKSVRDASSTFRGIHHPTFKPGRGFVTAAHTDETALRPLFVVNARDREEAVKKAEELLWKNINDPAKAVRWGELSNKWYAAGQLMVPRSGIAVFNPRAQRQ
jgi:hypothetical protein